MTKGQLIEALKTASVSGRCEVVFFLPGNEASFGDAVYCIGSMTIDYTNKKTIVIGLVKSCDDVKIM